MIRYLWCVLPIFAISLPGTIARADDPASVPSPCWMVDQTGRIVDLEEFCIDSEPPESSTDTAAENVEADATGEDSEVIILIDGANPGAIPQVPPGASPETTPDSESADPEAADPEAADPETPDPETPTVPEAADPETPTVPEAADPQTPEPEATPPESPTVPEAVSPETPTVPEATSPAERTDRESPRRR